MARGGRREGAGRKPGLDQLTRWGIGAQAHNLLKSRAREEAEARIGERGLIARSAKARAAVEAKFRWPEVRAETVAQRRRQLAALGWSDADLDELAKNTVVSPPPGMAEEIASATQAVFGTRKRGYSEPIRRPYRARAKQFENNVLEQVADEAGITLRMVETCLGEYRAFLKRLVEEEGVTPDAL